MHKWVSAAMMALTGAVFFAAFVLQDIRMYPEVPTGELPWGMILRYLLAMTLGGALAGVLFSGLFGRRGFFGWVLSLLGGVIATAIAGVLGSAFGLLPDLLADGYHTADLVRVAAGVLVLPLAAIEEPLLLGVFAVLIGLTHLLCRRQRTRT